MALERENQMILIFVAENHELQKYLDHNRKKEKKKKRKQLIFFRSATPGSCPPHIKYERESEGISKSLVRTRKVFRQKIPRQIPTDLDFVTTAHRTYGDFTLRPLLGFFFFLYLVGHRA